MDQVKIGKFISDLRKEQGLTQQLSDAIGVSNKTISKWECGKGLPEIYSVMPLCQILQIKVNELLSGERLQSSDYSRKAEENMMNLIQETENTKKRSNNSLSMIIIVIAMIVGVGYSILSCMGVTGGTYFIDAPTLLLISIFTVLFLLGTKLGRPFLRAFKLVVGKKPDATTAEIAQSEAAVDLCSKTILVSGGLETIMGLISLFVYSIGKSYDMSVLGGGIYVSLLGIFYGVIGYLVLLPIKAKLKLLKF